MTTRFLLHSAYLSALRSLKHDAYKATFLTLLRGKFLLYGIKLILIDLLCRVPAL